MTDVKQPKQQQDAEEKISVEPILVVPARKPNAAATTGSAAEAPQQQAQPQKTGSSSGGGGGKQTPRRNSGGARQWTQKKSATVTGGGGAADEQQQRNRKPSERTVADGGDAKKVGGRSRENSAKDAAQKKPRHQSDSAQKGKENREEPPAPQQTNGHSAAAAAPHGEGKSAADRRNSYKQQRVFSATSKNKSSERRPSDAAKHGGAAAGSSGGKRVFSKSLSQDHGAPKKSGGGGAVNGEEKAAAKEKKRTGSTASNGKLRSQTSEASTNGESFDYEGYDLEEPFSDSEDETPRAPMKPSLAVPRGRIRTLSGTIPVVGFSPKWGGPTMCPSCLQFFDLPDAIGKFADHLLEEHHIVIEEVDLIVDPKRYVEHWRQRFAKESIDKIFPKVVPDESNPFHGKVEYYFEMSERIPEDYALRQRLAMRRLEEALACQQREREETNFRMPCIFCRYTAKGNRSKIIHHLYMIHHLNLGSPDNLVFVAEYIDHLKEKLNRNECIYCEKTFADRNTLMDHMRKRNHREVNPKNNYYDKFYIINYLELGKRWLDVLAEDFEDTMPTFADSDDEEEEESWHEWQEDNVDEDELRVVCLFCEDSHDSVEQLLEHFSESHKFNLLDYVRDNKLAMFDRMKLLNHLRKETFNKREYRQRPAEDELKLAEIPERDVWDKDENLVPMFDNDHLLWTLESYLDEKHPELTVIGAPEVVGGAEPQADSKSAEKIARQDSTVAKRDIKEVVALLVDDAKRNTVEGVEAEDWPDLTKSALADAELYKSLR